LCSAGTATTVSGSGLWTWSCLGLNGGRTAQCSAPLASPPPPPPPGGANKPGPSSDLFNAPFYTCSRNFYVATTGSDTNTGTTQTSPWKTIQKADATIQAGDCVNVLPGTYASGARISRGGNAPSPTGYVVYRCTQLDACIITDANRGFEIVGPN